jgi:hypothetical protein
LPPRVLNLGQNHKIDEIAPDKIISEGHGNFFITSRRPQRGKKRIDLGAAAIGPGGHGLYI